MVFIIINLNDEELCMKNAFEFSVTQYFINSISKVLTFRMNIQGSTCRLKYKELNIQGGLGFNRFLIVDMEKTDFIKFKDSHSDLFKEV